MAYGIACSKIWDPGLVERLKSQLNTDILLITQKDQLTSEQLEKFKVKRVFFPHWSHIIKPEIFNNFECIIFHMTDLPYGRGGSPLQNLIVRGHKKTKISALRCTEGLDEGPIYLKADLSLEGTAQEIYQRSTGIIEKMIIDIVNQTPSPKEQQGEPEIFSRRKPDEGNIDQLSELNQIYDYIRMLDAEGYPSAFIELNGIKYEFKSVKWNDKTLEANVRIIKI